MKPLNIAIVCDAITDFTAGSFISALRFSEGLADKGHKVIIITSRYPHTPVEDDYKGLKIYRLRAFPVPKSSKRLYFAYPSQKEIRSILLKDDIQIVHFMLPTPLCVSAAKSAKKLGLKVIAHSHTQPENWTTYIPRPFSFIKGGLVNLSYRYIRRIYEMADAIICPTEFSEMLLRSKGFKTKTYVISNGVDINKFQRHNTHDDMQRYHIDRKKKILLFVGRLDPEKNVSVLIQSLRYLEKISDILEIFIVGDGSERERLEMLAKTLGVDGQIRFLGKLTDSELQSIYNICHVFVLPSFVELEGMVVLEAISYNKPILIADSPDSASRFIVGRNGFLFDPHNPKDLAAKIKRLFTDEKLYKLMSEESHKMRNRFDIKKSITKLEKVYSKVLSTD